MSRINYNNDYVDGNAAALGLGNRNNDGVLGVDFVYRMKFNTEKRSHYRNIGLGFEHNLLMEEVIEAVKQREKDTLVIQRSDTLVIQHSDTIYSVERQVVTEKVMTEKKDEPDLWFVYFDNGSFALDDKAVLELQQMAYRMTTLFPDKYLILEGSCDATGSDSYNKMLAKYRAREVRDHLIKLYNIDPNRLIYKGVGKIKNVQSSFAPNRRVLMYLVTKEEAEEVKKTLKQEEE